MQTLTPDPTFYPSPKMATQAPPERLAYVALINPSGTGLVYSTYLGGDIFDTGSGIAIDAAGNAYVTGNTLSFTFPVVDAFQPVGAGQDDAFVAKLNAAGSALVYSSYLGGSAVTDVEGVTRELVVNPVQFDERPPELRRGPQFAEHTDELLREIGLSDDDILELKVEGAVT